MKESLFSGGGSWRRWVLALVGAFMVGGCSRGAPAGAASGKKSAPTVAITAADVTLERLQARLVQVGKTTLLVISKPLHHSDLAIATGTKLDSDVVAVDLATWQGRVIDYGADSLISIVDASDTNNVLVVYLPDGFVHTERIEADPEDGWRATPAVDQATATKSGGGLFLSPDGSLLGGVERAAKPRTARLIDVATGRVFKTDVPAHYFQWAGNDLVLVTYEQGAEVFDMKYELRPLVRGGGTVSLGPPVKTWTNTSESKGVLGVVQGELVTYEDVGLDRILSIGEKPVGKLQRTWWRQTPLIVHNRCVAWVDDAGRLNLTDAHGALVASTEISLKDEVLFLPWAGVEDDRVAMIKKGEIWLFTPDGHGGFTKDARVVPSAAAH